MRKSLNISFDVPATAWHETQRPLPKNTERTALLGRVHRGVIATSKTVDGCVRAHDAELELGDRAAEHREVDRGAGIDGGEQLAKAQAVIRVAVQSREHLLADRLVA
jgi:hypothetical protein